MPKMTDDEKKKLKAKIKTLDEEELADLIDALDLKPDASKADILATIEALKKDVDTLKKQAPKKSGLFDLFGL